MENSAGAIGNEVCSLHIDAASIHIIFSSNIARPFALMDWINNMIIPVVSYRTKPSVSTLGILHEISIKMYY